MLSAVGASYAATLAPSARVAMLWAALQLLCAQRLGCSGWHLCWWPGLLFYATGHYCEFAGLQYAAGMMLRACFLVCKQHDVQGLLATPPILILFEVGCCWRSTRLVRLPPRCSLQRCCTPRRVWEPCCFTAAGRRRAAARVPRCTGVT